MNENTNQKSCTNLPFSLCAHRLILIDGSAILHRAYHALPPLTSSDGKIVNAVYGVVSMLLKIYHDFAPTHMAVAFDRPAPTFRKKMFAGYQAQRPILPDDFISQIGPVHEAIESFGIPIYEKDGFEADDIIGTIAKKTVSGQLSADSNLDEVIIVTGDRDLLQLVDDKWGIKVFLPVKGLSEGKLLGETEAASVFGVPTKKIPDYKGLAGDSSDNYPGVSGIGPKTAIKLINQYGSVEKIIASGELGEKAENAHLSKELATIRCDVPIAASLEAMKITTLATPQARMKLAELGFKSLLKRLSEDRQEKKIPVEKPKEPNEEQLSLV